MKDIDADYYGYRDDDDGLLLPIEATEEKIGNSKNLLLQHLTLKLVVTVPNTAVEGSLIDGSHHP